MICFPCVKDSQQLLAYSFIQSVEMSRPRRFTAQKALQLIQQLDESNSGESGDDINHISASASESSCLSEVNASSSNSDGDSDDGEIPMQRAMPLDVII
jgi:hypothetical protein